MRHLSVCIMVYCNNHFEENSDKFLSKVIKNIYKKYKKNDGKIIKF